MRVKANMAVKGRGIVTVVEDTLQQQTQVGDVLTDGTCEWEVTGAELAGLRRVQDEVTLHLRGVNNTDRESFPDVNTELSVKPKPLLDQKIADLTVREAIEIVVKQSDERVDLAVTLKKLGTALTHLELRIGDDDEHARMDAFKHLRETFNEIPPKWFHR